MLEVTARTRLGAFALDAAFAAPVAGVTALFGRSGSGKTTVLNVIAGLHRPRAGRVALGGEILLDTDRRIDRPPDRRRIGYVFQDGRLFPHLDVRGNLEYGMRRGTRRAAYATFDQVVALLGIGGLLRRRPATLSGGERQRVAIGRALLTSPRLLLMDEPLAALDAPRKAEILPFVGRLQREFAVPIVYVSHAVDEVLSIADTVVLMDRGAVAAAGPAAEVASRLDEAGFTDLGEAGTVFQAVVESHDSRQALTRLDTPFGPLLVARLDRPAGAPVRLRLRARDIALALERPQGVSVINIVPGTVAGLDRRADGTVGVAVAAGAADGAGADGTSVRLRADITRLAAERLGLAPGTPVHAMIKAVAVDRFPHRGGA